ncbi:MAG: NAD(P)H-hydrate dehydratase [Gemmatimonadales bacterium]
MADVYPPLRPHARGPVPAPTAAEAAAIDRRAIERDGVPQAVLMESAGRAAAAVLDRLFPTGPVLGLVGAGNNGGDALVVLRTLLGAGREVRGVLVADRPAGEALLHGWPVPLLRDADLGPGEWRELFASAAVVVDGVLGTGASGAPRERQARALTRMNESGRAVLALDVPSGIDASTGAVAGVAAKAAVTVAMGAPKLGSLLHPARALVGRLVAVDIGFPPPEEGDAGAWIATPAWARARVPRRPTDTHKKAVGSVLLVAGRLGMAGAAVLAARAAFRAGAGLVRVCSSPSNREILQSAVPEAIWVDASDADALGEAVAASDAVGAGPGLGTDDTARSLLAGVLAASPRGLILDADALNLAAAGAFDLRAAATDRRMLLTPHPGEMARLLTREGGAARVDAVGAARAAAARFGCAVLLKGAPSVVVEPTGPARVDSQSSSDLAVAGMGDALTGVAAALLAQGLDAADAGSLALYLSGRAARIAGRGAALVPSDVIRHLPEALAERGTSATDLDLPFVTFDADAAS